MKWLEEKLKFDRNFLTKLEKLINKKGLFWSGKKLIETGCYYGMVFSERSDGKTTYGQCLSIYNWYRTKAKTAYITREETEIKKSEIGSMFNETVNLIPIITDNKYNSVFYRSKKFYLSFIDEEGNETVEDTPFMECFSLTRAGRTKSKINDNTFDIIWFEEFMTRNGYLTNEFLEWTTIISTIVRLRDNVFIFMSANTVNKYCPYFKEMGLYRVSSQQQGTTDLYNYGESDLLVAVEYPAPIKKARKIKKSNVYFAFDNPRLEMVKSGAWEIANYPHVDWHRNFDDIIVDNLFLNMDDIIVRIDIAIHHSFVYCYFYSTNITAPSKANDMIFINSNPYNYNEVLFFKNEIGEKIMDLIKKGRAYYQDNEIGEIVNNFLRQYRNFSIVKK